MIFGKKCLGKTNAKLFQSMLLLLVVLLTGACGGESSEGRTGNGNPSELTTGNPGNSSGGTGNTNTGNTNSSLVPPNDGSWQGTWARQTLLAAEDNASAFHRSYFLPSIHYLDNNGLIFGIQFEECMVSPITSVAGELPGSWNFFLGSPGVREFLSQNGDIGNLIFPVAFPTENIDVLDEQRFIYRDLLLAPYGLDIRKVSRDFLTNSIWLVDAPGVRSEQYLGCANLFWERESDGSQTVSSLFLGIPINLSDGQVGALTAEFTFVNTSRVDQIRDNGVFTGPYQLLDEATLRTTTTSEFDNDVAYRFDRLGVSVDLLSDNRLLITMTGEEDDIPVTIRGIVYASPADWFRTPGPGDIQLTTDLSFSGAREDRDGDGYADSWDDFPDDPLERADNDSDGIGDNADPDDDNDGTPDAEDPYPRLAYFGIDTDGDGIPDQEDSDLDGDGVNNLEDVFPRDATEAIDTDADGVGNNADTDDDGDGIADTDDLVPLDARCGSETDALPGDCIVDLLAETAQFAQVGNTVYATLTGQNVLLPVLLDSGETQVPLGLESFSSGDTTLTALLYSSSQRRLYAGFSSGAITVVDVDSGQSSYFHTLPGTVRRLAAAGNYILAQASGDSNNLFVINNDGIVTHSERIRSISEYTLFDIASNRLLYTEFGSGRVSSARLDPLTGTLADFVFNYETDGQAGERPLTAAPDGQSVVSGGGRQLQMATLETLGNPLRRPVQDVLWHGEAGLLSVEQTQDGALLQRYSDDFSVIDEVTYPGQALGLYQHNDRYYVLTIDGSVLTPFRYVPSTDSDNDGVNNFNDAFPVDPAASVDTDGDGAPDEWNAGSSAAASTTALQLDAYPNDPACYRADQGDGTQCDYSTVIPNRIADKYTADSRGIVYMLFSDENLVYRWDMTSQRYLEPLYVGDSNPVLPNRPTLMDYSASNDRLYLAYPNGQVTSISTTANTKVENLFVAEDRPIISMGVAGDYLFVASSDFRGLQSKYYNAQAEVTDTRFFFTRIGSEYTWNESSRRLYFIWNGGSPQDLYYDQLTRNGTVADEVNSPYHGDYSFKHPILLSPDRSRVYLGSSHFFDAESLDRLGSISREFTHGVFLPDGRLAVLTEENGNLQMALYATNHAPLPDPVVLPGTPLGLYYFNSALHVFTHTEANGTSVRVLDSF